MNNATKIMSLTLDAEYYKVFNSDAFFEDEKKISITDGAYILRNNIRKHFSKHIHSFNGRTMFESNTGMEKIKKILNKKLTFYMRNFRNKQEREGAEKMFLHIKKEFNKIKK